METAQRRYHYIIGRARDDIAYTNVYSQLKIQLHRVLMKSTSAKV